jgi:hypothetical protein
MRPRTLAVLLVLVAGLGAFVWFYERKLPGSDARGELEKKVFAGLEADEVTRVVIASPAGTVELERPAPAEAKGETEALAPAARPWRLVRPLAALADGPLVDGLVGSVAGLEKVRTLTDLAASDAGLDEPEARIELATAGRSHVLLLGHQVPAGGGRIVGTGETPPYFVVAATFDDHLERMPGDWRSRSLFAGDRAAIERVTLVRGTERLLLARRGEDFWVEAPYVDRADTAAVNRLLGAVTGLRAERFLDAPPADAQLGLAPPAAVVETVLEGEAEPFRVELGGPVAGEDQRVHLRVGGLVVEASRGLADALADAPEAWRSLAWASLEVFEIDRVEVRAPGTEPLVLERAEGEWRRDGEQIEFAPASDFLYALTGARAQSADAATVVGEPQLTVVLEGEERAETLELFAAGEGRRPARVSDRDVVLWLSDETLADVEQRLAELRAAPTSETTDPAADDAPAESTTDVATGEPSDVE